MSTNNVTNTSVTGLYQYIVAAGAILFPGTPVNQLITGEGATADAVTAALQASGLDLTGVDPATFKGVVQTLIAQHDAVASLSGFLGPLADPNYQGTGHGTAQLGNLFESAKTLENAINLHISAASLVGNNAPGTTNQ